MPTDPVNSTRLANKTKNANDEYDSVTLFVKLSVLNSRFCEEQPRPGENFRVSKDTINLSTSDVKVDAVDY